MGYSQTSPIRSSFIRFPRHPEEIVGYRFTAYAMHAYSMCVRLSGSFTFPNFLSKTDVCGHARCDCISTSTPPPPPPPPQASKTQGGGGAPWGIRLHKSKDKTQAHTQTHSHSDASVYMLIGYHTQLTVEGASCRETVFWRRLTGDRFTVTKAAWSCDRINCINYYRVTGCVPGFQTFCLYWATLVQSHFEKVQQYSFYSQSQFPSILPKFKVLLKTFPMKDFSGTGRRPTLRLPKW